MSLETTQATIYIIWAIMALIAVSRLVAPRQTPGNGKPEGREVDLEQIKRQCAKHRAQVIDEFSNQQMQESMREERIVDRVQDEADLWRTFPEDYE